MIVGFLLDLWLGDPQSRWHPICLIGRLISACEKLLRRVFPPGKAGERVAGALLVVCVVAISAGIPLLLLIGCAQISLWLAVGVDVLFCWLLIAIKTMRILSMNVYDALMAGDILLARECVQRIVGRDAKKLDASGVTRAAIETVAESTVDGIISLLFFIASGFSPLGFLFKAVSTMDSMVGYTNDRYRFFGTAAARLDDVLNFIPARIGGVLMCVAAKLCRMDAKEAWHIFRRDRKKHASPNSAHAESAMAGALNITLGGDATYFGELVQRPTQGDGHAPEVEDIRRANRLMIATAWLSLGFCVPLRVFVLWMGGLI